MKTDTIVGSIRRWVPAWLATAVVLWWLAPAVAVAGPLADLRATMSEAYGHYKEAAFALRTGNVGVGAFALEQAIDGWRDLAARHGAKPPEPFSEDPHWQASVRAIGTALADALVAVDDGDVEQATQLLQPVRGQLAALRWRNGLWSYADCIDAMNAAMDELWRHRHAPPDLTDRDIVNRVKAETAVVAYWYERCVKSAPAEFRDDATFVRLFEGATATFPFIWQALDTGDVDRLIGNLRGLRSYDRLIWLRFG